MMGLLAALAVCTLLLGAAGMWVAVGESGAAPDAARRGRITAGVLAAIAASILLAIIP